MLTREQVEAHLHCLIAAHGFVSENAWVQNILDHDAALRAKVEEVTLRRSETIAMCDQLRAEIDRLRRERTDDQLHTDNIELRARVKELEART